MSRAMLKPLPSVCSQATPIGRQSLFLLSRFRFMDAAGGGALHGAGGASWGAAVRRGGFGRGRPGAGGEAGRRDRRKENTTAQRGLGVPRENEETFIPE